ncbi:MAG: hypothetical protein CM1200mP37_5370 [Chloroflexota bacterium]|nr:MAG: hypothetical protein CM1200mP37_5370 [Chloroflexota bacterium]
MSILELILVSQTSKVLAEENGPYAEEIKSDIKYQVGALSIFSKNKKLQHIKPHGALYNMAVDDQKIATSICEALLEIDPTLILLGLSGSQWLNIAEKMGIQVAHEVFADRSYNSDGTLVSRKNPKSYAT